MRIPPSAWRSRRERYGDRWAPVYLAFTDSETGSCLDGQVAGAANTCRVELDGTSYLVSGAAVIDRGRPRRPPIDADSQLMNPVTTGVTTVASPGDIAGAGGTRPGPSARHP